MRRWQALVLDLACVLVFVVVGRRSHAEQSSVSGALLTAAPFCAGLAVASSVAAIARWPAESVWPPGITAWMGTLSVGMALRGLVFDGGVSVSFVLVAGTFLAATMLGWRLVAGRIGRGRQRQEDTGQRLTDPLATGEP